MLKPWFMGAVSGFAWVALAVALWLTLASVAFLWMAGLLVVFVPLALRGYARRT